MSNDMITEALLDDITDAFNAGDINRVMAHFAQDAVFDHGVGPAPQGARFEGTAAIRAVFEGAFAKHEILHWETLDTMISGNRAVCTYLRRSKPHGGDEVASLSVDILTFAGSKITHKDTYFKAVT